MELLDQWGEAGFEKYVLSMQAEYQRRAAILHAAVEKVQCLSLQNLDYVSQYASCSALILLCQTAVQCSINIVALHLDASHLQGHEY